MVQFYETYAQTKFVAPLVRQIPNSDNQLNEIVSPVRTQFDFQLQDIRNTPLSELSWTHHLTIFSRCKTEEEREFYFRMAIKEKYTKRELDRQISASLFERIMIGNAKLSALSSELNTDITNTFKDSYVFEFLNLPEPHSESDLQKGLIKQMKNVILELGRDLFSLMKNIKYRWATAIFTLTLYFIIGACNVW